MNEHGWIQLVPHLEDLCYVGLTLVFFGVSALYARWCETL